MIEILMGHTVRVANSFMKPTEKELLQEYSKAVGELTIVRGMEAATESMILKTFNRQFLANSGYAEEEKRSWGTCQSWRRRRCRN